MVKQLLLLMPPLICFTTNAFSMEIPRVAFEAWEEYRDNLAQRGFVVEQTGTTNGKPAGSTVYRWSSAGASMETDNKALAKSGVVAYVRNGDYAFQVARDVNEPWRLKDVLLGVRKNEKPISTVEFLTRDAAMAGLWGLAVQSVLLPDAIENGWLIVESVREVIQLGKGAVEVTIRAGENPIAGLSVNRGTLLLRPDYSWMIAEARLELLTKSGTKGTAVCERKYTADSSNIFSSTSSTTGMPAVISHERSRLSFVGRDPIIQDLEFRWRSEAPTAAQFRLTHYGLPEPASTKSEWTRYLLIVIYSVVVLFSAALLLRRWRARRAT